MSLRLGCDLSGHLSKKIGGDVRGPRVDEPQLELPTGIKIVKSLTCPVERDDASRGPDHDRAFRLVLKLCTDGAIAEIIELPAGGFGDVQRMKTLQELGRHSLGQGPGRIWPATENVECYDNI